MRQRRRVMLITVAALLGLAGCSDAPVEEPSHSATVSVPPSAPLPTPAGTDVPSAEPVDDPLPTPEPLPLPEYPADLELEDTAENALIAAEYFLELMNYIQSTGDVEPFEEVAAPSCSSCADFILTQRQRYEAGGFLNGNRSEMLDPVVARTSEGLAWVVTADWDVSDGDRFDPETEAFIHIPGAVLRNFRIGVQLDSEWEMLDFAKAAQ